MRKRQDESQGYPQETYEAYGEYQYEYQPQQEAAAVRRAKQKHKKNQRGGFIKLLVALAVICVGIVVVQETMFRLQTVYVIGNEQKTPQQIVTASGLVRGRNMLGIEEEEVAAAISRDHTLIFKGMQKEYPGTIYLYIEERKTVAAMQWLGILYTLDAEGIVMSERNSSILPEGLPVVTGFNANRVTVGQKLSVRSSKQLEAYQQIMMELDMQMYADQVSSINLADVDNLYLVTVEGVTVRLGDASHMRAKIGSVRSVMTKLRQLGSVGGVLDVTTPEEAKYMPDH